MAENDPVLNFFFFLSRISEPQHYWKFGLDKSSLWNSPVYCRMFNSVPGFYPLDASGILTSIWTIKNISMCPQGERWRDQPQLRTIALQVWIIFLSYVREHPSNGILVSWDYFKLSLCALLWNPYCQCWVVSEPCDSGK